MEWAASKPVSTPTPKETVKKNTTPDPNWLPKPICETPARPIKSKSLPSVQNKTNRKPIVLLAKRYKRANSSAPNLESASKTTPQPLHVQGKIFK